MLFNPNEPVKYLNLGLIKDKAIVDVFQALLKLLSAMQEVIGVTFTSKADITATNINGDAISVYHASPVQAIITSTYTKVILNTKEFDVNNTFDATTNYRHTPKIAGYYLYSWLVECYADAGTTTVACSILYKNGALYKYGAYLYNAAGFTEFISSGSCLVYMNGTTDYVELYAYIRGTNPIIGSFTGTTWLSGILSRR